MRSCFPIFLLFPFLLSCHNSPKRQALDSYNAGVSLNLEALRQQQAGNYKRADTLNKQSLRTFEAALALDSTHSGVRSALAHSLYVDGQFARSIEAYHDAIRIQGAKGYLFRELGLAELNLGRVTQGRFDLDKAFTLDTSKATRALTVKDLQQIGELGFRFGEVYIKDGDTAKGRGYQRLSIDILRLAYGYSDSREAIARKIASLTEAMNIESGAR